MKLLLALCLVVAVQEPEEMPDGWKYGSKSGWDGECPPGWDKKTPEERDAFWKDYKFAKYQFIKHCHQVKDPETGPVTASDYMMRSVNAGLGIKVMVDLAKFGMTQRLKEVDFKLMLKSASAVYGTEIPQADIGAYVKERVVAGDRGAILEQRVKQEIMKRSKAIKDQRAKEEKEKKEAEKKKKKEEEEKKKKGE
jgi:hypothetical protein